MTPIELLGRLLVVHYVSHAPFPKHSLACERADGRHSSKYLYTSVSLRFGWLIKTALNSLRPRESHMDANRYFSGGDLGSGRPLWRFGGLWKLSSHRGHYCHNLHAVHLDRLCQLPPSEHDSYLDICLFSL